MYSYLCKFKSYLAAIYRKVISLNRFINLYKKNEKNIVLFGSPHHCNMGDQAQTYCILDWLKKNYSDYQIHVFTINDCDEKLYGIIRKLIKINDKIFFHSGYHLTDLYHEQDVYLRIIQLFPDYEIVIFPQTISYTNKDIEKETTKIFDLHKNIKMLCRDEISYSKAQSLFKNCKLLLYPDIVTALIGTKSFDNKREGILLCIRNDKEAYYKKNEIQKLIDNLKRSTKVNITDTTLSVSYKEVVKNRDKILNQIFDEYSRYKLLITDRYHGTIFSLIAGTPVIVISSCDHKLSSGVKWFPESFSNHVFFADSLEEAYKLSLNIIKSDNQPDALNPYFKETYYDHLKLKLEE